MTRGAAALAVCVMLACAVPISVEQFPSEGGPPQLVALIELEAQPGAARGEGEDVAARGARIVTARLLEELERRRDVDIVPPQSVRQALEPAGLLDPPLDLKAVGAVLRTTFGAQGVLTGRVNRYRERVGSPRGATRPAAVAFDLALRDADGLLLWRGSYEEWQNPLTDDPGSFGRAWNRGFRWVSAEQLAAYGAHQIVQQLPGPDRPSD